MHSLTIDTELDDESDDNVTQHEQNPGVDDGFFVGTREEPEDDANSKFNPGHGSNGPPHDLPPFPYSPGFNPNVVSNYCQQLFFLQQIGKETTFY